MVIKGEGMRITSKRNKRSDKRHRIQTYVDSDTQLKFNRLARACDISESQLGAEMIKYLTNLPNYVGWIQDRHGVTHNDPFRIIPVVKDGKTFY